MTGQLCVFGTQTSEYLIAIEPDAKTIEKIIVFGRN
jgi:hypothetical protein